jgi:hypothetical protein
MFDGCVSEVEFKCPSCGLYCRAESSPLNGCVIIHALPTCRRYDDIDSEDEGADFIRDARLKQQN